MTPDPAQRSLDCLSFGELLVDFCQVGNNASGYPVYEANPGGAPANVAAALARWGLRSGFIGKVGRDALGRFLAATLAQCGVDCSWLLFSERPTTLAMVANGPGGERSFDFRRQGTADTDLRPGEVPPGWVAGTRIFHFGSVSLTTDPVRSATLEALAQARAAGALISFDPNLRPALWDSLEAARRWMLLGARGVDLLKVSGEELGFLGGREDLPLEQAARALRATCGARLLLVTLGAEGCLWLNGRDCGLVPAPRAEALDSTGAGDIFLAGVLFALLRCGRDLEALEPEELARIVRFGNAAGALSTETRGALPSIPDLAAISSCLAR